MSVMRRTSAGGRPLQSPWAGSTTTTWPPASTTKPACMTVVILSVPALVLNSSTERAAKADTASAQTRNGAASFMAVLYAEFMVLGAVAILLTFSPFANAQIAGRITGSVVDPSGAAVPRATVNLLLHGGKRTLLSTTTTPEGLFTL